VTLAIAENSCTAIIGGSGSGKSTIASLILSLYETPLSRYETATISIRGVDIRSLHTPSLRSLISIVSQQPTIFPGTIHHNICYGLRDKSPLRELHNVRAAAQAVGIDDFIVSLPDGYSTAIGDGGVGLSGGQAQRLVIARALVRRPQVLILDEATSSLDPESAKVIRQTVQRLVSARSGLTVIIITHAREMMEIADNIVVLQQGSIVEQGPYEVLARRRGGKLKALIEDSEGVDS
jgi:ATP-binding cassette subfamily B (MDR/TAP) protein 1